MFSPVTIKEESKSAMNISLNSLVNNDKNPIIYDCEPVEKSSLMNSNKKNSKKTKKDTVTLSNGMEMVPAESNNNLDMMQSNQSYNSTYEDTTNMLKISIGQIDSLTGELKEDLNSVRASKTLKNKYNYIPEMSSTLGSLLSTKLAAIREINKTITDSHNLELKRMKDLKLTDNEKDDDKYIMDMYNAFISTPVSGGALGPSTMDLTMPYTNNIVRSTIGDNQDAGFELYQKNMGPTQQAMRLERDPNIQTVVMFEPESGRRWFDVVNTTTGESIPNVPRPDQMFLEDTTIDVNSKLARNTNLDQTYPLVLSGEILSQY